MGSVLCPGLVQSRSLELHSRLPQRPPSSPLADLFSPYALHIAALPSEVTDQQHAGYSKIASISVHGAVVTPALPPLTAKQIDQWQVDTSDFTHVVNTSILGSSAVQLSHYSFCSSTLTSGHLLIDLFGLSKAQCQAAMMHYKLLKLQAPSISAHLVLPAVTHYYSSELFKPEGILMQTCLQFHRARRKAYCFTIHLWYNAGMLCLFRSLICVSSESCGYPLQSSCGHWSRGKFCGPLLCSTLWLPYHLFSSTTLDPAGQRSNSAKLRSGVSFHANTWIHRSISCSCC